MFVVLRKMFENLSQAQLTIVELTTEYSIKGYCDSDIGDRVLALKPSSVDQLIKELLLQEHCKSTLLKYTSEQHGEKEFVTDSNTKSSGYKSKLTRDEVQAVRRDMKCSFCDIKGHIRKECPECHYSKL